MGIVALLITISPGCDSALPDSVPPDSFVLVVDGDANAEVSGEVRLEVDSTAMINPDTGAYIPLYFLWLDGGDSGGARIIFGAPPQAGTRTLTPDTGDGLTVYVANREFRSTSGTLRITASEGGGYEGWFDIRAQSGGNPFSGRPADVATAQARFSFAGDL